MLNIANGIPTSGQIAHAVSICGTDQHGKNIMALTAPRRMASAQQQCGWRPDLVDSAASGVWVASFVHAGRSSKLTADLLPARLESCCPSEVAVVPETVRPSGRGSKYGV